MVPGRLTHGMNEGGQIHVGEKKKKEKNKNFTTLLLSVPSAC